MPTHNNPLARHCGGCIYLGRTLGECNYWWMEDKLRPCPPGKQCTVKNKGEKKAKNVRLSGSWSKQKGYELYLQGWSDKRIGLKLGATENAVRNYRRKNWGQTRGQRSTAATWDTEKAFQMYKAGATDREIYEA
ncbi:MAG: hypothetical protein J6V52_04255, partial [Bacteroidaceae bacterium]|nr:hypothetical protein [Bacteroidaceae bacterium]